MSNDVIDLFKQQGAQDVGLDEEAADEIVANLNANTLPMCVGGTDLTAIETDDITLLMLVLDASPSMEPVEDELIREFNETLIPALKGASSKSRQAIIIGGLVFDGRVRPLWNGGFLRLDEVPKLTKKDYRTGGGSTALYQAQLDALGLTAIYSARVINETNTPPKVIIAVLSDGANNCPPYDADEVKKIADKLSREIFVLAFAGFETFEPVDFHQIAKDTGFEAIFETKLQPGESQADKLRRLRHLIGTLSSSVIRQSQTQVTPSASQSFWSV